ncbi:MAG TPA: NAD(P)-dependent oxidoreductase [Polyangiaceae bacterium]|nr:NAD(P)-dependent oxidoreductase [Polyangiaceae bacterium]
MPVASPTAAAGARVLVTGSAGFVGRHVLAALARRGARALGVDRPGSGAEFEADLADPAFDPAALWARTGPADAVVYMAANITRTSSVDGPARANVRVIVDAPLRLLEAAPPASGRPPHLAYCSTFKVYGPARQALIHPETHPQRPDPWSYGSAKALAERALAVGAARAGFEYAVVRPTCIYGPGQHGHNAIPLFLTAALGGRAPTLYGDGQSVRDDVFVPDLAELLVEAALRRARGSFNAAGERRRTILEVAELCCEVAEGLGAARQRPALDASRPAKWWLDQRFDLGPTRQAFGYEPTSLRGGLEAQARWLREGAEPARTAEFGAAALAAARVAP